MFKLGPSSTLVARYTGLRDNYRHGPKYMSVEIPARDVPEEGYKAGEMVRIEATEEIHARDCALILETCPALFEKGFVSFPRIVDMDRGKFTPSVLVRLKEDVRAEEIPYLFRIYADDGR